MGTVLVLTAVSVAGLALYLLVAWAAAVRFAILTVPSEGREAYSLGVILGIFWPITVPAALAVVFLGPRAAAAVHWGADRHEARRKNARRG